MKKTLIFLLTALLVFSILPAAVLAYNVTLYAPDGRTHTVDSAEIETWKAVGWSQGDAFTTVYKPDGQAKKIRYYQIENYKNSGWYTEPVTTMYAPDGRTTVIYKSERSKWEAVGWIYGNKTVTIYAPDGRKAYIFYKDLKSYKALGWYDIPVTIVYSPKGLQRIIATADVPQWEAVGWSKEPDLYVYNKMMAMKDQYPEGMPWTNENFYAWNGGIYSGGFGCAGFAFILSDAAFGNNPSRIISDNITINALSIGDILRINNDTHSVVVLEIHSDYIVVAEGNYNSSIHWGRKLYKDAVENATYIMTRYPQ